MPRAYSRLIKGTSLTWMNTGGDKTLTLTSLANGSVRQGDKSASLVHARYGRPELLEIRAESAVAVAATNGTAIQLFMGESDNSTAATDNPGGLSGADGALTNGSELISQLNYVGALLMSNATGTGAQKTRLTYNGPVCEYVMPVVYNNTGQALSATASLHKLVITPYYRELQ